jgi:Domain of unknown function (DUF4160)
VRVPFRDVQPVPRISAFHGVVVYMYYEEHGLPHFHARYAGYDASIQIDDLAVLQGSLPRTKLALVRKWAGLHKDELQANWERARREEELIGIDPLP